MLINVIIHEKFPVNSLTENHGFWELVSWKQMLDTGKGSPFPLKKFTFM